MVGSAQKKEKAGVFIAPCFVICHARGNFDGVVPTPDGLASTSKTPPLDHCVFVFFVFLIQTAVKSLHTHTHTHQTPKVH